MCLLPQVTDRAHKHTHIITIPLPANNDDRTVLLMTFLLCFTTRPISSSSVITSNTSKCTVLPSLYCWFNNVNVCLSKKEDQLVQQTKDIFFSNNGRPVCWEGVNVTVLQVVKISGTPFSFATRGGTKRRKVKKCMY